ncbi:MAG TPA: hypothetical protein VKA32_04375 [Gammaproteobacteria bacterium]|nr:hypothetical protein [Gammaproteobacteria bacterium]
MDLVSHVPNPRSLIERPDELENRRSGHEEKGGGNDSEPRFDTGTTARFLEHYRNRLDGVDTERKTAALFWTGMI